MGGGAAQQGGGLNQPGGFVIAAERGTELNGVKLFTA